MVVLIRVEKQKEDKRHFVHLAVHSNSTAIQTETAANWPDGDVCVYMCVSMEDWCEEGEGKR